jgi:hypothetical protein
MHVLREYEEGFADIGKIMQTSKQLRIGEDIAIEIIQFINLKYFTQP